jgi:hypothetical protein
MATNLDTLTGQEKTLIDSIGQQITQGAAAQAKLAQVQALYTELLGMQQRRKTLVGDGAGHTGSADASYADATHQADAAVAALGPVDTMLAALPVATQSALDDAFKAPLASPPDPAKTKFSDYVDALAAAQAALTAAGPAADHARVTSSRAREDATAAENSLQAAVDRALAALKETQAARDEALKANGNKDIARAYFYDARAKAAAKIAEATETSKAVTDADAALKAAYDAYADATDKRLQADAATIKAKADLAVAADQLGIAQVLVLKALADAAK